MRILHLDSGRSMRGGQWQALHLIRALRDSNHEPVLLAPRGTMLLEEARLLGVETAPLNWRRLRAMSANADLVHCHDARTHTLAALWARAPFVVSRRVAFPVQRGRLSRWKYACASQFLAISQAVRAELIDAGVDPARITVIHDATPLPAQLSRLDGPVVALDSDDPGKGMALLRRTGLDIHYSSNLAVDLLHASLFVYITGMEGLGSAALVAMAHGVPVVASRVGGLPEIVRHEVTGLLVENEPSSIAAAVTRLLDDHALAARLAAAGRHMVESQFTIERMVKDTLAAYRMVTA